jgi:DNA-binding MarR family transcriptional regulator
MSIQTNSRLTLLDVAFTRVRRLWESPALRRRFVAAMGLSVDPGVVRTLRAVDSGAGCGVNDVAANLGVEASTASRLVDAGVSAGYLSRSVSPEDRRRSVLTVTEAGADVLQRALVVREQLLSELTADWTDHDIETLATLLERLGARVADLEQQP